MSADDAATSFDAAFRAHVRAVRAYTLRRTAPEDAADIVAGTCAVPGGRWDDAPADPLPWLLAIARRVLANARRTSSRASRAAARVAAEPQSGRRSRARPLPRPRPSAPPCPACRPSTVRR